MYVEILDEDTITPNDLVDLLLIDHNQTVEQPLRQNHTGVYNFVTMDLTITVVCAENFEGSDCTQCAPGFTGVLCETNINDCVGVNCSGNDQCVDGVNNFTCECAPGFRGPKCSEFEGTNLRNKPYPCLLTTFYSK